MVAAKRIDKMSETLPVQLSGRNEHPPFEDLDEGVETEIGIAAQ